MYKRATDKGRWEKIVRNLVEKNLIRMGRKPDPRYSLIDSQSVKTTDKAQGIDEKRSKDVSVTL